MARFTVTAIAVASLFAGAGATPAVLSADAAAAPASPTASFEGGSTLLPADPRLDMERHREGLDPAVRDALGAPVAEPLEVPTGYRWNHAGGALLWSSTPTAAGVHPVAAVLTEVLARYDETGGPEGMLGFPVEDTAPVLSGAWRQAFESGRIYWSAATGARVVRGGILDHYLAKGGASGLLGLPTTDQLVAAVPHARVSRFEGGRIYWSSATGARVVRGAVLDHYLAKGGEAGLLGLPTTDQLVAGVAHARVSRFEGGRIYWSSATGARVVRGAVLDHYLAKGGEAGLLGLPTTDEVAAARPGSRVSVFERGRIYWSSATGAHAVQGAIHTRYVRLRGAAGILGLPTGEEVALSTGARQWFQGEYLLWDRAAGRTFVRIPYSARARGITAADVPHTWRPGCPVPPSGLRMMRIVHRAWNGDDRFGALVVRASVVDDMQRLFGRALRHGFPIRRMVPVDRWGGDDIRAMEADNTSAFNCRHVTGNPYRLSQHSYGNAIDINTVENPYVTSSRVYPAGSGTYLDRSWIRKGMIVPRGPIALGMAAEGWKWGARWSYPDYQHFSSNGG